MKAKIKIGIDFDNTIICYDNLFSRAVQDKKWDLGPNTPENKSAIKERLIQLDGNDFRWQELQAIVYGVLIKDAEAFPQCLETIKFLSLLPNVELFIVSHKTSHSLYLKHITLIDKAQAWLKAIKINEFIPEDHIFFKPTRDEKIQVIKEIGCDFFIDDLEEVLHDKNFPHIHSIYFSQEKHGIHHWAEIRKNFEFLVELGFHNLKSIKSFSSFPFTKIETIKRDGNNKIIFFQPIDGKKLILKKYSQVDHSYSTLVKEYSALELLHEAKLPVPKAYFHDPDLGVAIYEHIESHTTAPNTENIINDFSHFLTTLNHLSQQTAYENFANARDFRDQLSDYTSAINRRLLQIENGCLLDKRFNAIGQFIQNTFKPLHQKVLLQYQSHLLKFGLDEKSPLPKSQKILSPSDFGMHNAIFDCTGHFTFIDFEYFGWDDPAKLIADFLHHAGQDVISTSERLEILKHFTQKTHLHPDFFKRLSCILDLVGLEWMLIILNIANPEVLQRRLHANPNLDIDQLINERLLKAEKRADFFHTNISSNSVFLSLKSIQSKIMEIPVWQQLIT